MAAPPTSGTGDAVVTVTTFDLVPLEGVAVELDGTDLRQPETDAEGRVVFEGLAPNRYNFKASHPEFGFGVAAGRVAIGGTANVVVVIVPRPDQGAPELELDIRPAADRWATHRLSGRVIEDGAAGASGEWISNLDGVLTNVSVLPGGTLETVDVRLSEGEHVLALHLVDREGRDSWARQVVRVGADYGTAPRPHLEPLTYECGAIVLRWSASASSEVQGFRILKRDVRGGGYEHLGSWGAREVAAEARTFRDTEIYGSSEVQYRLQVYGRDGRTLADSNPRVWRPPEPSSSAEEPLFELVEDPARGVLYGRAAWGRTVYVYDPSEDTLSPLVEVAWGEIEAMALDHTEDRLVLLGPSWEPEILSVDLTTGRVSDPVSIDGGFEPRNGLFAATAGGTVAFYGRAWDRPQGALVLVDVESGAVRDSVAIDVRTLRAGPDGTQVFAGIDQGILRLSVGVDGRFTEDTEVREQDSAVVALSGDGQFVFTDGAKFSMTDLRQPLVQAPEADRHWFPPFRIADRTGRRVVADRQLYDGATLEPILEVSHISGAVAFAGEAQNLYIANAWGGVSSCPLDSPRQ